MQLPKLKLGNPGSRSSSFAKLDRMLELGNEGNTPNMLTRREFIAAMSAFVVVGCNNQQKNLNIGYQAKHAGYPYHPLVFHADLSILAYQLYGQSLVWPFDPYYELMESSLQGRESFIKKIREWANATGLRQENRIEGLNDYRGPGVLASFPSNEGHDPILFQYGLINPWSDCLNYSGERWLEYKTPKLISQNINQVYVAYQRTAGNNADIVLTALPLSSPYSEQHPDTSDVLLAFEGGTGDKGECNQPHSQSLMGFVLMRKSGDSTYDVHITFRGSRSGSASRALIDALSESEATGNPDWITDMGYDLLYPETGGEIITQVGGVARGFAESIKSILPKIMVCLQRIADIAGTRTPNNIYVTGHSLGGALAQQFVSAILLGKGYGPDGKGELMPENILAWPWTNIKLITYSAPRAGDKEWAKTLTETKLESEFFTSALSAFDSNSLTVTEPSILSRLLQNDRPAAYRVLISADPITTEKLSGGKHVGKTVYVDRVSLFYLSTPDAHELINVRKYITDQLLDGRIPQEAWCYKDTNELVANLTPEEIGTAQGYEKLASAIKKYYVKNKIVFDHETLNKNLQLYLSLLNNA